MTAGDRGDGHLSDQQLDHELRDRARARASGTSASLVGLLAALHLLNLFAWQWPPVDLNTEASLGTWLQSTQFSVAGLCAAGIAVVRRAPEWALVAALALGLSIDDVTQLHERFEDQLDDSSFVSLAWVVVPLGAAAAAVRLLRRVPRPALGLLIAGAALLGGSQAVGMVLSETETTRIDDLLVFAEELGELVASSLFVLACVPEAAVAARRALR